MKTGRPMVKVGILKQPNPSGGALFACVSTAIAAVVILTMVASLGWSIYIQRSSQLAASLDKASTVSRLLAGATEALLASNETSRLRRVIAEAAMEHELDECRVLLPSGQVVADADPTRITPAPVPDRWYGPATEYSESATSDGIKTVWPIEVPGRGHVRLEIAVHTKSSFAALLEQQGGLGVVCIVALGSLLAIRRYANAKLRPIQAIRQALLTVSSGQRNIESLGVCADYGPEAEAWNMLLAERQSLDDQALMRDARKSLQAGNGANSDIGAACDGLPHGLVLVEHSGRIRYVNGAASVLLEAAREELVGAELANFIENDTIIQAVKNASTGPSYERSLIEVERSSGSSAEGVLRYVVRPVRREDNGSAMIIIEDITQKRVADESRNAFLAQAAHELRTPLTNIRLYVEMAQTDGQDDPTVRAKSLNVINDESQRLERIVADILSVSEIEAGSFKLRHDDVRFEVLLDQLKADYEPQAKDKQIQLTFEMPPKLPVVQGDRDKLVLALHNLIGNALKYTQAGGRVTVNAEADNTSLSIDVIDTGIGIHPEETEKIFEKFYRARDSRVSGLTGSGIGLALAREVIRMHGGDIVVKSELDKGSYFTLTLPISAEAA